MSCPTSRILLKYAQGPGIPKRMLGKTGLTVTQLGLGGESLLSMDGKEDEALAYVAEALKLGIDYFDTAPIYKPSEERLGKILPTFRNQVTLASKTHDRTRDGSLRILEKSLKKLNTDYLDIWQIHHIDHMDEVEQIFAPGGAMEALQEARDQGMVRFLGITGHYDPTPLVETLRRFDFDTILTVANAADVHQHSFIKKVLPVALSQNLGIIGMKVCSRGFLFAPRKLYSMEEAFRYVLSLPLSTTIIGHDDIKQLHENIMIARDFHPMTDEEMREAEEKTKEYANLALFYRKGFEEHNPFWTPYGYKRKKESK